MELKARSHSDLRLKYGQTRQKVVFREADDVFHVDVEFKTSYSRYIDVAGCGKNRNGIGRGKKFWTAQNFSLLTTTGGTCG